MAPRNRVAADKARGGEIVLRRPWQRGVFIAGLAAPAAIALALALWIYWR